MARGIVARQRFYKPHHYAIIAKNYTFIGKNCTDIKITSNIKAAFYFCFLNKPYKQTVCFKSKPLKHFLL